MWIPEGAALIRWRRLFETWRLLEEIRYAKTHFLNRIFTFFSVSIVHLELVNAARLFHSGAISIKFQFFQLPVY